MLQLAPTIRHQCAAILSLLRRYGWRSFSVVTGKIAGHGNFQQVREKGKGGGMGLEEWSFSKEAMMNFVEMDAFPLNFADDARDGRSPRRRAANGRRRADVLHADGREAAGGYRLLPDRRPHGPVKFGEVEQRNVEGSKQMFGPELRRGCSSFTRPGTRPPPFSGRRPSSV